MKKTIIVVPKYTERVNSLVKALMADSEFASSRFCALLSELDPDSEADNSDFPLELERLLWNTSSIYASASALLQIENHFSGYPDEILVIEDLAPFCERESAHVSLEEAMRIFALGLPGFLMRLIEETKLGSIVHIHLDCGEKGIVSETVSGALGGFYAGLRLITSSTPFCSLIYDETGSIVQLAPFCVKVMNISRKEHKDYVFSGKSGFFGKL